MTEADRCERGGPLPGTVGLSDREINRLKRWKDLCMLRDGPGLGEHYVEYVELCEELCEEYRREADKQARGKGGDDGKT